MPLTSEDDIDLNDRRRRISLLGLYEYHVVIVDGLTSYALEVQRDVHAEVHSVSIHYPALSRRMSHLGQSAQAITTSLSFAVGT